MDIRSRYSVLEVLGGSGTVYAAVDRISFQKRVIKILALPDYQKELHYLRMLQPYEVPRLLDAYAWKDGGMIVMQMEEGETLESRIRREGPLPEEEILSVSLKLCAILMKLQQLRPGVLHLDLKPSNVWIRTDGSVCLLDFGSAARFWPDGTVQEPYLGTYGYMDPAAGTISFLKADLDTYGFGRILSRMMSGYAGTGKKYHYSRELKKIAKRAVRRTGSGRRGRYSSAEKLMEHLKAAEKQFKGRGEHHPLHLLRLFMLMGWSAAFVIVFLLYVYDPRIGESVTDDQKERIAEAVCTAETELFYRLQYMELLQAKEDFSIPSQTLKKILWQQEISLQKAQEREEDPVILLENLKRLILLYVLRGDELGTYADERVLKLCGRGLDMLASVNMKEEEKWVREQEEYFLRTAITVLEGCADSDEEEELLEMYRNRMKLWEMEKREKK